MVFKNFNISKQVNFGAGRTSGHVHPTVNFFTEFYTEQRELNLLTIGVTKSISHLSAVFLLPVSQLVHSAGSFWPTETSYYPGEVPTSY